MALDVLIVCDKFKGTLSAEGAARAIAKGWARARPGDTLDVLPMTDGGDGFGALMGGLLRAQIQRVRTVDAATRPCWARWWWEPVSGTAIVESAAVIGLAMLPPNAFHPFELDTFGLGAVLRSVAAKGAKTCLLGIGGSATNDGGFGLARALGWEFFDHQARSIEQWTELHRLARVRAPAPSISMRGLQVAVDVHNPLLGARGATRVYGPQKGLGDQDREQAERCLRRLAQVVRQDRRRDLARVPGAGAAGGLGFGLHAFLAAPLVSGFDLFAARSGLRRRLRAADLVLVAEGALDSSSFMGKGVGQVARLCHSRGVPCIALAGVVVAPAARSQGLTRAHALTELTTLEQAQAKPAYWLERLSAQVAGSCQPTPLARASRAR